MGGESTGLKRMKKGGNVASKVDPPRRGEAPEAAKAPTKVGDATKEVAKAPAKHGTALVIRSKGVPLRLPPPPRDRQEEVDAVNLNQEPSSSAEMVPLGKVALQGEKGKPKPLADRRSNKSELTSSVPIDGRNM